MRRDPRWDTMEARGLYYARLILDLELTVAPIAAHLFEPADEIEPDEDRTALALDVLGRLVRLGRREAAAPLRRYAAEGANGYAALDALLEIDDPALAGDLDDVALARCGDDDLMWLCARDGAVVRRWAARHPRIAALRKPALHRHEPRPQLGHHSDDALVDLTRGPGRQATAAILELGRRRSPLVLALAERLLPRGDLDGPLCRAIRDLGPLALPRARSWVAERRSYADVGVDVLAAHGGAADRPPLRGALAVAVHEKDWDLAAVPADGLGRLRDRDAIPLLLHAWEESASSQLRAGVLGALLRIDPHVAEPYLVEGLWDCEDAVRRIAASAVPADAETVVRLRRLAAEDAEDPDVRAAAGARVSG